MTGNPLTPDKNYFEIEILDTGMIGAIGERLFQSPFFFSLISLRLVRRLFCVSGLPHHHRVGLKCTSCKNSFALCSSFALVGIDRRDIDLTTLCLSWELLAAPTLAMQLEP